VGIIDVETRNYALWRYRVTLCPPGTRSPHEEGVNALRVSTLG